MKKCISLLIIASIFMAVQTDNKSEVPSELFACPELKSKICTEENNNPVCAWLDPRINCVAKKYPCATNASNACYACNIRDVIQYSKGPCPASHVMLKPKKRDRFSNLGVNTVKCASKDKEVEACEKILNPVCAWFDKTVNCDGKSACGIETSSPCEACKSEKVERYSLGSCPPEHIKKENDHSVFTTCEPHMKNEDIMCTAVYEPKCAWYDQSVNCIRYPCAITAGNACEACKISNVEKFSEGECPN